MYLKIYILIFYILFVTETAEVTFAVFPTSAEGPTVYSKSPPTGRWIFMCSFLLHITNTLEGLDTPCRALIFLLFWVLVERGLET